MKCFFLSFVFLTLLTICLGTPVRGDFLGTFIGGHADIGVAFEGGALSPHIHADTALTRFNDTPLPVAEYEADQLWIGVTDGSKNTRSGGFADVRFNFLGVNVGQDFWHLRSTTFTGQPFLGLGTEELGSNWGPVTFTINSISPLSGTSGTSQFSMWKFNPEGELLSASTVSGGNSLVVEAGGHDHWNMAFTGEGVFDVNFGFSSRDNSTNTPFSATETFTFAVGNANFQAVPEPSSFMMLGAVVLLGAVRLRKSVIALL